MAVALAMFGNMLQKIDASAAAVVAVGVLLQLPTHTHALFTTGKKPCQIFAKIY